MPKALANIVKSIAAGAKRRMGSIAAVTKRQAERLRAAARNLVGGRASLEGYKIGKYLARQLGQGESQMVKAAILLSSPQPALQARGARIVSTLPQGKARRAELIARVISRLPETDRVAIVKGITYARKGAAAVKRAERKISRMMQRFS